MAGRAFQPRVNGHEIVELREQVVDLRGQVEAERNNNELLVESITELERALTDPGWIRMLAQADLEFSADGLTQLRAICRLYAVKNPLIKRGLALRSAYVWGQGVEVTARANGRRDATEQDVHGVIQAFLDDPTNVRCLSGSEARDQLERSGLGCEGEVFLACFTDTMSGRVQVRTLNPDEIIDVVCNPDDSSEPWYYHRSWTQNGLNVTSGLREYTIAEAFYPCIDYQPKTRPARIGQVAVAWDAPVLHLGVNRPRGWRRGIPDAYAAIDWARGYKEFLEDWARLMKALSRYAWKATTPGSKAAALKAKVATPPSTSDVTGGQLAAGATVLMSPDVALEAVSKSGATLDSESGRPLAMMVAAALGVPVTMLLADPGLSGARATAETLDRPTELEMSQRRELWTSVYQRLFTHVIGASVKAPKGKLKGSIARDEYGRDTVVLTGGTDATVDMVWPALDGVDAAKLVESIVKAGSTAVIPPEELLRLLLAALGVRNVDQLVETMLDDQGQFVYPGTPGAGSPAGLARAGGDSAAAGGGPMGVAAAEAWDWGSTTTVDDEGNG